jgi:hypothetical protein
MATAEDRERRTYLVTKWQRHVTAKDMASASSIMELFGLDVYSGESPLPHRHLHFPQTASLLEASAAEPAPNLDLECDMSSGSRSSRL